MIVFTLAGVWGIVVLTPLYFLLDVAGRQYAPPTAYPQFFYGFLSVTMAWQIAFLLSRLCIKCFASDAHQCPIRLVPPLTRSQPSNSRN